MYMPHWTESVTGEQPYDPRRTMSDDTALKLCKRGCSKLSIWVKLSPHMCMHAGRLHSTLVHGFITQRSYLSREISRFAEPFSTIGKFHEELMRKWVHFLTNCLFTLFRMTKNLFAYTVRIVVNELVPTKYLTTVFDKCFKELRKQTRKEQRSESRSKQMNERRNQPRSEPRMESRSENFCKEHIFATSTVCSPCVKIDSLQRF